MTNTTIKSLIAFTILATSAPLYSTHQSIAPWENPAQVAYKLSRDDKAALINLMHAATTPDHLFNPQAYYTAFAAMEHRVEKPVSLTGVFKGLSSEDRKRALYISLNYIYQHVKAMNRQKFANIINDNLLTLLKSLYSY